MAPHKPRIGVGQLRRFKLRAPGTARNGRPIEGAAFVVTSMWGGNAWSWGTVDILLQGELVRGWDREWVVRNSEVIG